MFNFSHHLARRVSIAHKNGRLVISIRRHNDRVFYILLLLFFTIIFGFFCAGFVAAFFRAQSARGALYALPFALFICLWYFLGLRVGFWRAFGVEEIVINQGTLRWERKALCWTRKYEAAGTEVTEIVVKTPWHGLRNRVQFTSKGRIYSIGDMILRDEADEIARELRSAIPTAHG